jgi:mRNA-degrading endonuclease toxin of MazEF toxin-antitoxin module
MIPLWTCTTNSTLALLTLDKSKILRKLGALPDSMMQQVNKCLKAALELP